MAWPPAWPSNWSVLPPHSAGQGPVPQGMVPGDVIFFCPAAPSPKQHAIYLAQSMLGYDEWDACFTHVALCAGNGHIHDSVPKKGVRHRLFANAAVPACHIRVRRLKGLTPQLQFDICQAAAAQSGPYALAGAVWNFGSALFLRSLPQTWQRALQALTAVPGGASPADPLYCGQLVELAILKASKKSVIDITRNNYAPMPAAFSTSSDYDEVPISW